MDRMSAQKAEGSGQKQNEKQPPGTISNEQ